MILEKDEKGNTISSCKDCIFAVYHQSTAWHRIQTGCKFSRVEKFRERGTPVDWINGDAVSHHQIHTFCNNIRDESWRQNQHTQDLDFLAWKVSKDNEVRWSPVIWAGYLPNEIRCYSTKDCILNIMDSICSILDQKIPPQQIVISIDCEIDFVELISEIKSWYKETGSLVPLFFNRVLSSDYERQVIDSGLTKITSTYYVAIRAGTELPEDFIEKVNIAINTELKMVAVVHNEDKSILMVSTLLHKSLNGNVLGESDEGSASFLEEKLKIINGETGILEMGDLYANS